MIAASDLSYNYGGSTPTIKFPDFQCEDGGQLLLLGDSGTGKTTLLHLLCGLLKPLTGFIKIDGQDLGSLSDKELDHFRGRKLGIVFQQSHFVQSLTIAENLALPDLLTRSVRNSTELRDRIHGLLGRLGVGHKANSLSHDLSVGEQQRASIARALIHNPSVLFVDEPTSALDDKSTESVVNLLKEETANTGTTLIIVTHDQRLKSRYSDQIILEDIYSNHLNSN